MIVYRASELGSCDRALVAKRLGYEPKPYPEDMQRRMDEGKLHEEDVLRRLQDEGWVLAVDHFEPGPPTYIEFWGKEWLVDELGQITVTLHITETIAVVGHVDNLGEAPEHWSSLVPFNIEVKSMSKDEFRKWTEFRLERDDFLMERYKWQFSGYGHATGFPTLLVVKDRNSGEIDRVVIEPPALPRTRAEITMRVLRLEGMVARGELPECNVSQWPCPFYYLNCTHRKTDEPALVTDSVLDEAASAYRDAVDEVAKWSKVRDSARLGLDEALGGEAKVKEGGFGRQTETWTVKEGRTTRTQYNATLAKEDGVDLEKYKSTSTTYYPKVERRKDGSDEG